MFSTLETQSMREFFVFQSGNIGMSCGDFLTFLLGITISDIFGVIKDNRSLLLEVTTGNIPQYSNVYDVFKALDVMQKCGRSMDMYELGYYLRGSNCSLEAQRKYGENHYKFACQLGLAVFEPRCNTNITELGRAFCDLGDNDVKKSATDRLIMRIPFLQRILVAAQFQCVSVPNELGKYLSPATVARRRSNMHNALNWLAEYHDVEMNAVLSNIEW